MIVEPLIAAAVSIISVLVAVFALLPARAKMTGGKNSKEAAGYRRAWASEGTPAH